MNPSTDSPARDRFILSLDAPNLPRALNIVRHEQARVGAFRIGLGLLHGSGPPAIGPLRTAGATRLYYDAQLLDIPSVVAQAGLTIASWGVWMVTVQTLGGLTMLQAARRALRQGAERLGLQPPLILGTTLLPHLDPLATAAELGLELEDRVVKLAALAQVAGLDGVVVAPPEIARVRAELGTPAIIVARGIRDAGQPAGDLRRPGTTTEAIAAGANYVIVSPSYG